jgi:predicted nucleic acid-binding protein
MNLAIIGQLDLIKTLFDRVLVPQEVWNELTVAGKGKPGSEMIRQAEWLDRQELGNNTFRTYLNTQRKIWTELNRNSYGVYIIHTKEKKQ